MNKVIIVKGTNIIQRTRHALEKLSPNLPPGGSKILIKPNLVEALPAESGATTRPEAVAGVIEFLGDINYEILIGESSASWNTWEAFEKGGYKNLERQYKIKLVNFDEGKFIKIKTGNSIWPEFEITKYFCDVDYVVSVAVLKEHPYGVTLSCKNMMGVLKPDPKRTAANKMYIHKEDSVKIWAERLAILLKYAKPHLAIIDGTTGMYGSHVDGKLKKHGLTIASEDAVACDIVGAEILGHESVFYLEKLLRAKLGKKPGEIQSLKI
jgi:uncharacterized protein (DUF362 family)